MSTKSRYFSDAARAAAVAARKNRAALEAAKGDYDVFTIRCRNGYIWQIRRFGGIVMKEADEVFSTTAAARNAGKAALSAFREPQRLAFHFVPSAIVDAARA